MKNASPDLAECWELVLLVLAPRTQTQLNRATPLFGPHDGVLDSLAIVEVIFALEDVVLQRFGVRLKMGLADLLATQSPPFATAGSLCDFLYDRLRRS